jgi:hypothetical protein
VNDYFISKPARRAHTLLEMIMAMTATTILMAGLSAAVVVTSKAFRPETTAMYARTNSAIAESDVLVDLRLATGFTERTSKAATFSVPDRDGDGRQEKLRYAWSGTSGDPLTLSYNGATPMVVANDVRSLALNYVTSSLAAVALPAEQTGSLIAMIVNDSGNPSADELTRKSFLESWNFQVVLVGFNDGNTAILNAASTAKAVYLSGLIDATKFNIGTSLSALSVGIVNEHPDLVDDIGLAGAADISISSTVSVVENAHYITSGLALGNSSISTMPITQLRLVTGPSPNLNSLAAVSSIPALATVDPGKLLSNGRIAAGRRVMIPWGSANVSPMSLNNSGLALTRKAIEWATGLGSVSVQLKRFGYETVFTTTNGTSSIQYSTKAALADKARVRSISAYVGGANDQVRFALYSSKSGQPDKLLVQSDVGTTTTALAWVTLPVPATDLAPGSYWLAFSFKNSNQRYRYTSSFSNAGERNKSNTAVANGFLGSWGTSNNSNSGARSIYATYEVLP